MIPAGSDEAEAREQNSSDVESLQDGDDQAAASSEEGEEADAEERPKQRRKQQAVASKSEEDEDVRVSGDGDDVNKSNDGTDGSDEDEDFEAPTAQRVIECVNVGCPAEAWVGCVAMLHACMMGMGAHDGYMMGMGA